MKNSIRHDGIIESVEGEHVRVRILQTSACAGCQIAGRCAASESKVKVIDVIGCSSCDYRPGDAVVVATSGENALRALAIGFAIPLLLLLVVLAAMLGLGFDQGIAALSAIAVLIPYYICIWAIRRSIASVISFTIEKN